MFKKILIANRGEIALRIQRACRELGIKAVVVYSEADRDAKYVKLADEAVCIGPAPSAQSYLNMPAIISAAEVTDAEAIHPGYGFLSENADFAERVEKQRLHRSSARRPSRSASWATRSSAKQAMIKAGVPCVPGSEGALPDDPKEIDRDRARGRLPGDHQGGRRRRRARHARRAHRGGADQRGADDAAPRPARRSATRPSTWRSSSRTRATSRSRSSPTSTRTRSGWASATARCSGATRRSSRKRRRRASRARVIEKIGERCAAACKKIGYRGAGTFEFLYENGEFYFIEMNTRVQVEHPVTELVTGIDIVQTQIRVAAGEKLPFTQRDDRRCAATRSSAASTPRTRTSSRRRRAASRCGIAPGGPGVRVDSHVYTNYFVPPNYDSMIGKIIVHGDTREQALARMRIALSETVVEGIQTNIPLHRELMVDAKFIDGGTSIHYLEGWLTQHKR